MAKVTVTLVTKVRWWVTPLLYCYAAGLYCRGRNEASPRVIEWVADHGIKTEIVR